MKKPLSSKFFNYIKLLRIFDWLKNIFVFVPLVFSKLLFTGEYFPTVVAGFFIFSLASSIVYIFNDITDAENDSAHPFKRNRPIANGSIRRSSAYLFTLALTVILFFSLLQFNLLFVIAVWAYVGVNILYSLFLKELVIVDIFCIASGFMFRILAGAYIINVTVSNWLVLTTIFISLFLAIMKRRVEIVSHPDSSQNRTVLKQYSIPFLDQIAAMTGSGVIFSYALYTVAKRTVMYFGSEKLVFTTAFVIFGIFRYMYLVYKKDRGENVIQVLLTDWPMLINLFLYVCGVVYIIY